ncbi:MAG: FAD binding domain-containing protein [Chloroflexota bacterium]|nr:FAD binding domain-containing protein [Chloroflexota bacterium]
MPRVKEYYRPSSLEEALALLQRSDCVTVPLAGGTRLVPRLRGDLPWSVDNQVDAVVDLADLGLNGIERRSDPDGEWLTIGATTTLTDLFEHADCRTVADGVLAEGAGREGPVNLRNAATVGGCIVQGASESELLLALLALDARVEVNDGMVRVQSLTDLVANPAAAIGKGLITEIRIPLGGETLRGGAARIARTPSDSAIIAAVAVGDGKTYRIALGGLSYQPLVIDLNKKEDWKEALETAVTEKGVLSDFRGSADYRRAMAAIVIERSLR